MTTIDYNGQGRWSVAAVRETYNRYAIERKIVPRNILPREHTEGERHWIFPVIAEVIAGIEADDPACAQIGIEFIEEDEKFAFGRILKSNAARALRRATLTESQCDRVRTRVFSMLRAGKVPHEFREYAKLVRSIGFNGSSIGEVSGTGARVQRFRTYFEKNCTR